MENMLDKQNENALDTTEEMNEEVCESTINEENTYAQAEPEVAEPEVAEEVNEKEADDAEDVSEPEYLFEEVVEEASNEDETQDDVEPSDPEDALAENTYQEDQDSESITEITEKEVAHVEDVKPVVAKDKRKPTKFSTYEMVGIGIFSALAFVVSLFVRFPVQFLTFDAKDAVITIAAFVYGPISAAIISLIVAFIEMITVSNTMWYGFLMNFASSAVFATTASLIYRKKRNLNGAIIGLYSAIAATVGIMLLLNIFITPLYFGLPVAAPMVMEMLPTLLLPFNFAKALMNSAIVMIIYKPVVTALKRLNIVKTHGGSSALTFNKTTKIILALGAVGLALSITIFLILVL